MKIKNSWDLKLLYEGDSDAQIENDLREIEKVCKDFESKYKGKNFTSSPESLFQAFVDHEELSKKLNGFKPWWYFALKIDLNSEDKKSNAVATKNDQRITNANNRIKFFGLEIAKIPESDQDKFVNSALLKNHSYRLVKIFKRSKFNLTEGEEQLEDLLSQTSYTMWVDTQNKLLNQQTIKHKNKDIPIVKASGELSNMAKAERRSVYEKLIAVYKSISHVSEAEINAIYNYKKIMDERRGYKKPYSSTILSYENDEECIEDFVALVTRYFKISHRFYKLHAKLLKEKKLHMADRNVNIGKIKTKFDFETSVSILRSIFERVDSEYVSIFDSFLKNGQIDVFPKKGKRGGAYCWGRGQLPTFVLLNHTNDVKSMSTLAHEMGHAIHTELSKSQPPHYRTYSTSTAEVASTFFEQIAYEEIEKRLSEKEKIVLLHDRLLGDVATIFRQIACFNFENELHEKIRKDGQVSKEQISEMLAKNLRAYLGSSVEVKNDDGYFFVNWSHIRRFFYVYTYAYGQIISRALYEKWKQDPSYATKIKQFLSAGGSMSPEEIFKSIGIDTSKTAFFESGLKSIESDIVKLEKLTNK